MGALKLSKGRAKRPRGLDQREWAARKGVGIQMVRHHVGPTPPYGFSVGEMRLCGRVLSRVQCDMIMLPC